MSATAQGAQALDKKVAEIQQEARAALESATELYTLAAMVREDLAFRIRKNEPPAETEIPQLHGALVAKKAEVVSKVNAIQEPTIDEFQALAETPNP